MAAFTHNPLLSLLAWSRRRPGAMSVLAAGLMYFALAELGLLLTVHPENVAGYWPAAGAAAGWLAVSSGRRAWVVAAFGCASLVAGLLNGRGVPGALLLAVVNALGPALFVYLLDLPRGGRQIFDRGRHGILRFAGAALASAFTTGIIGAAGIALLDGSAEGRVRTALAWFAADLTGLMTVTPLVFAAAGQAMGRLLDRRDVLETLAWSVALIALTWMLATLSSTMTWLAVGGVAVLFSVVQFAVFRLPTVPATVLPVVVAITGMLALSAHSDRALTQDVRVPAFQLCVVLLALGVLASNALKREIRRVLQARNQALQLARARAEETRWNARAAELQRNRLAATFETVVHGIAVFDAGLRPIEVNSALARMLGFASRLELLHALSRRPWHELVQLHDASGARLPLEHWPAAAAAHGETLTDVELEIRRTDTNHVAIGSFSAAPIRDDADEVVQVVLTIQDVTERRRAEADREQTLAALTEARERLDLALRAGRAGLFVRELSSDRLTVTGFLRQILAGDRVDGSADLDRWRAMIVPEDTVRIDALVDTAIAESQSELAFDFRFELHGEIRWMSAHCRIVRGTDGQPDRIVGINHDITERKRLEQSLQESDRRKDEFLATLAHELRNPLATLRSALQILDRTPDPKHAANARGMMGRQLTQLVRLLDDLLDVSRITNGKLRLARERLPVRRVVEQALENVRGAIVAQQHGLEVTGLELEAWVDGDAVRLAQVLSNLLHNAAKYSEPGGTIAIRVRRAPQGLLRIEVQDSGIGIAPESIPHVFELFAQIRHGAEKSQGGLGIGLALAQRLAGLHGGRLSVSSEGLGRGSTFTLELPEAVRQPESAMPGMAVATAGRAARPATFTIVVADDNRDAADSMAIMLQLDGHRVLTCYDGRSAIALIRDQVPQCAVVDIGMPGFNGLEVARAVRNMPHGRRILLVAVTGWGQPQDRRRTQDAGFDYHFTKPVEPLAMQEVLARLACEAARAGEPPDGENASPLPLAAASGVRSV